ncbi:MAG TPA: flagellar hook capping FlgD N-terminal domain-containing protein [Candidatus Solibacter sp.]|nr:flagellar hook capping FlgD N-terminal domain-containing protein [Candidatus Solibacter sp.]
MSPTTQTTNTSATSGASSSPATATASAAVTKNMFLQLLVAQLKNQDPLNPTDPSTFMSQLAQFQQLEQSMNTGEDITAIRQDLDNYNTPPATGGVTPTT